MNSFENIACFSIKGKKYRFLAFQPLSDKVGWDLVLIDFEENMKYYGNSLDLSIKMVKSIISKVIPVSFEFKENGHVVFMLVEGNFIELKRENLNESDRIYEIIHQQQKKLKVKLDQQSTIQNEIEVMKKNISENSSSEELNEVKKKGNSNEEKISKLEQTITELQQLVKQVQEKPTIVERHTSSYPFPYSSTHPHYYHLPVGESFTNSSIITNDSHSHFLNDCFGVPNQEWTLLYKGSVQGFTAANFHKYCDNQGELIVVVRTSNGYIFGGYTSVGFSSVGSYRSDSKAFLFSINNGYGDAPRKIELKNKINCPHAIYDNGSYLATFGSNHDLCINNGCNGSENSYTNLGGEYQQPPIRNSHYLNFLVTELEVFKPINRNFLQKYYFRNSNLGARNFTTTSILNDSHANFLNDSFGVPYQEWTLLYRGSAQGYTAANFHKYCDNQGEVIVIVRSTCGYIFGGYTSVGFKSLNSYRSDSKAFLFSLVNAYDNVPRKIELKNKNNCPNAIYDHSSVLAAFGGNHDLQIPNNCNSTSGSTSLGHTFVNIENNQYYLVAAGSFVVSEIEVFKPVKCQFQN